MSDRGLMLLPDAQSLRKRVTFGGCGKARWVSDGRRSDRNISTQPSAPAAAGSGEYNFEGPGHWCGRLQFHGCGRLQFLGAITRFGVMIIRRYRRDTDVPHQSSFWIVGPTNGPTSNTRTPRTGPIRRDPTLRSPTAFPAGAPLTRGGVGFLHRQTRPLRTARPTWPRYRRPEPTAAHLSLDRSPIRPRHIPRNRRWLLLPPSGFRP